MVFSLQDIRARHLNATGSLSSIVQELGRLCRYVTNPEEAQLPSAILAKKFLEQTILKNSAMDLNSLNAYKIDP